MRIRKQILVWSIAAGEHRMQSLRFGEERAMLRGQSHSKAGQIFRRPFHGTRWIEWDIVMLPMAKSPLLFRCISFRFILPQVRVILKARMPGGMEHSQRAKDVIHLVV
ncbi:hypothetical protein D3C72_1011850 [compost metagenome]